MLPIHDEDLRQSELLLPARTALSTLLAGRTALSTIPGLNMLIFRGFVILYGLATVLGVAAIFGLHAWIIQPLAESLTYWSAGEGWLISLVASLVKALLWLGQFILMLGSVMLALRISLALMGMWFEVLSEKVLLFWRVKRGELTEQDAQRTWLFQLSTLKRGLQSSAVSLLLSLVALLLGFVPFVGPLLTLSITAYLLGRDVREPYLLVRASYGEDYATLKAGRRGWTFRLGLLPVMLSFVPVLGWLLLPAVMIYLVVGVAWLGEEERAGMRTART